MTIGILRRRLNGEGVAVGTMWRQFQSDSFVCTESEMVLGPGLPKSFPRNASTTE